MPGIEQGYDGGVDWRVDHFHLGGSKPLRWGMLHSNQMQVPPTCGCHYMIYLYSARIRPLKTSLESPPRAVGLVAIGQGTSRPRYGEKPFPEYRYLAATSRPFQGGRWAWLATMDIENGLAGNPNAPEDDKNVCWVPLKPWSHWLKGVKIGYILNDG